MTGFGAGDEVGDNNFFNALRLCPGIMDSSSDPLNRRIKAISGMSLRYMSKSRKMDYGEGR